MNGKPGLARMHPRTTKYLADVFAFAFTGRGELDALEALIWETARNLVTDLERAVRAIEREEQDRQWFKDSLHNWRPTESRVYEQAWETTDIRRLGRELNEKERALRSLVELHRQMREALPT